MSTRSVLAQGTPDEWQGRYAHWDGYPSVRAAQIFESYRQLGSTTALRDYALRPQTPGSWSSFMTPAEEVFEAAKPARLLCTYCHGTGIRPLDEFKLIQDGKCNVCQSSGQMINYDKRTGWVEESEDWWITNSSDDAGTEWAYLLTDDALVIFERRYGSVHNDEGHATGMFGLGASATEIGGYWYEVTRALWSAPEPDWEEVERLAYASSNPSSLPSRFD